MPQWQPDLSDLPDACRQDDPPLDSPTAVVEHIAEISTRFWLASACDRQLLQVAAAKVVAQHQQEILTFLQGPRGERGGTVRPAGELTDDRVGDGCSVQVRRVPKEKR